MAREVYHLALNETMLEGATVALLPGDPKRVEKIARTPPSRKRASWPTSGSTAPGSPTPAACRCW